MCFVRPHFMPAKFSNRMIHCYTVLDQLLVVVSGFGGGDGFDTTRYHVWDLVLCLHKNWVPKGAVGSTTSTRTFVFSFSQRWRTSCLDAVVACMGGRRREQG